jgi:bifunctional DNA-binding transcriptional regulator/antitoxin component of YhaV-PrlF toxin-antitoxin module
MGISFWGEEGNKMLLHVDSRKRITIPKDANLRPGDTVELEILPDGRLVLMPVATIPKHQLWAWTPEVRRTVSESLKDPRPSIVVESKEEAEALARRWASED